MTEPLSGEEEAALMKLISDNEVPPVTELRTENRADLPDNEAEWRAHRPSPDLLGRGLAESVIDRLATLDAARQSGKGELGGIEVDHSGMGAAYLRSHPDVPIVHRDGEPCALCRAALSASPSSGPDLREAVLAALEETPHFEPPVDPKIERWYAEGYDRARRDVRAALDAVLGGSDGE